MNKGIIEKEKNHKLYLLSEIMYTQVLLSKKSQDCVEATIAI